MQKRRITALAIACALILSMLAGCAKGPGKAEEPPKPAVQTPSENAVVVSTALEFLEAIAPDTEIFLKEGKYDLSEAISSISDLSAWQTDHPFVYLVKEVDSYTVEIMSIKNLTVSGEGTSLVEIIQDDPYADVLAFSYCDNVSLDHLTMGHKETPHCDGNVIEMMLCTDFRFDALDLYGCGTYGIGAFSCDGLAVTGTTIRDCSYGIINTGRSSDFTFTDCTFRNCREYESICTYYSELLFENCTFKDNFSYSEGFLTEGYGNSVYFKSCSFGEWETEKLSGYYSKANIFIDDKCTFEGNMAWGPIVVDSVEALFSAINEAPMAQGATIILEPGYYNLSEYINSLDVENYNGYHSYVQFEDVYDGFEPVVYSQMFGITSRSGKAEGTTLVVEPRYADVFTSYSSSMGLRGLTIGHTETGECSGGVVRVIEGGSAVIADCDLYGCGTVGINADSAYDLSVLNTRIHDCTDASLDLYNVHENAVFCGCELDGGGMWIGSCEDAYVAFFNNRLGRNESSALYFRDEIEKENNEWDEIVNDMAYPDVDPGMDFRYYLTSQEVGAGDIPGAWYAVWYTDYSEDIDVAMPYYDSDSDELFQLTLFLYSDGSGQLVGMGDDETLEFKWKTEDPYSVMLMSDPQTSLGSITGFADDTLDEPELYLLLYLDGAQIWFQNLNIGVI